MTMMDDKLTEPAIGISYKMSVGDGKEIVFQTYIPQELGETESHVLMDKLRKLCDRQLAFSRLDKLDWDIHVQEEHLSNTADAIAKADKAEREKIAANGNGGIRKTSKDIAADQHMRSAYLETEARISALKMKRAAMVKDLEHALHGGADSHNSV